MRKTDNFVVILNQIYRQQHQVKEGSDNTYVGIDGQQILIDVYMGGAVQENFILYRIHTGLPVIFVVGDLLLP